MNLNKFKKELEILNKEKVLLNKKYNLLSFLRSISFLVVLAGITIIIINQDQNGFIVSGIALLIFIFLVIKHTKLVRTRDLLFCRIELFEEYILRINGNWKTFANNGVEYLNENTTVANDLDLFGNASLYQYLCNTNTPWGNNELANMLLNNDPNKETILENQSALQEIVKKNKFSFNFLAHSKLFSKSNKKIDKKNTHLLLNLAENTNASFSSLIYSLSILLPLISLIAVIVASFQLISPVIPFSLIIFQWIFAIVNFPKVGEILRPLSLFKTELEAYESLFHILENEGFDSECMQNLQQILLINGGASNAVKKLNKIIDYTTFRNNAISYGIFSGLFMWDFNCIRAFDKWKISYGSNLRKWFEAVGKTEALLSLATIHYVKDEYCFPTISELSNPYFKATDIKHPLIPDSVSISNSLELKSKTCIITGSNMSGKTTFLRTIGVNLILFNAGGLVCAKNFDSSCMAIFTSMRIQDDVSQGISTFYAELIRIKTMVEYSKLNKPMLVLIDEIFRGTNSADRISGARATITKLTKPWIIGIVSTHDFELCNLEKEDSRNTINYHFDEYYENDQIKFDFKIKNGKSTSTNAQFLMKLAGVI
ncbi:MAG: putative mismatch repair ATPase MutS [Clostridiales bacterium]|jgi:hypothetical protein|nr:putative mismatch repair ATPase MutS [Clostridiales bacterium]